MEKTSTLIFILFCITVLIFCSCKKYNFFPTPATVADQSFVEEFDTASAAISRGWQFINTSDPKGSSNWKDGGGVIPFFKAYSNQGNNAGFIGVDYFSTSADKGVISNWLVSPSIIMQNGDKIIFYTRAWQVFNGVNDTTDFGNSLQVRINPLNDSVNTGKGLTVGSFTQSLLDINPDLVYSSVLHPDVFAYPSQWTKFTVTISGLNAPLKSRFTFRYFVTDGGSNGNASGIGIDAVAYKSMGY